MWDKSIFAVAGLGIGSFIAILLLWSLIWKGIALWISAKEDKKWWFIALLFFNTAGILEIVYIFAFSGWGRDFFARRKKPVASTTSESETLEDESKTPCDCTSCPGCDCDCHKPIESN